MSATPFASSQAASVGLNWIGGGSTITDAGGAFGVPLANWQNLNGANGSSSFSPATGGGLTVTWSTGGGIYGPQSTFASFSAGENQVLSGCLYAGQNDAGCANQISVTISGMNSVATGNYTLQLMSAINNNTLSFNPATVTDIGGSYTLNFGGPVLGINGQAAAGVTTNITLSGDNITFTICNDDFVNQTRAILNGAVLQYTPAPAPTITTQPLSRTAAQGSTVNFSAAATGIGTLTYQWQFNDADISGETATTLQLNLINDASSGNYRMKVTDANGHFSFTAEATLIVIPGSPQVVYDASTIGGFGNAGSYGPGIGNFFNVVPGTSVSVNQLGFVSPTAISSGTVTVQLFNAATATVLASVTFNSGDTATPVSGLPVQLYLKTPTNTTTLGPGSYAVVQYGGQYCNNPGGLTINTANGAIVNGAAKYANGPGGPGNLPSNNDGTGGHYAGPTLQVSVSGAPAITQQPLGGTFAPGSTVNLSVTAGGSLPLSYQWRKNNSNISGATSSTFSLTNVTLADTASYQVVVNNSFGSVTSVVAAVTVAIPPTVTVQLNPGIVLTGTVGGHYQVEYSTAAAPATWLLLQNIPSLPSSPYAVIDPTPTSVAGQRFYRGVLAP